MSTTITDLEANIRRLPPGASAEPLDLNGDQHGIGDLYRSIESRRLIVLGQAGSGKSVLAVRLVLDLLRGGAGPDSGPVPVIFGIGSWDPTVHTLRGWLTDRLLRDHPYLARGASPTGRWPPHWSTTATYCRCWTASTRWPRACGAARSRNSTGRRCRSS
ncbi:hypothetical protein ACFQ60_46015 [Streptomyces zhihengii]